MEKWRDMLIHSCTTGQFSCRNGQCIELKRRCDYAFDCTDKSDERNYDTNEKVYSKFQNPDSDSDIAACSINVWQAVSEVQP